MGDGTNAYNPHKINKRFSLKFSRDTRFERNIPDFDNVHLKIFVGYIDWNVMKTLIKMKTAVRRISIIQVLCKLKTWSTKFESCPFRRNSSINTHVTLCRNLGKEVNKITASTRKFVTVFRLNSMLICHQAKVRKK